MGKYLFKVATEPGEFERIHRLVYRTFVEEIRQHPGDGSGKRVDPFLDRSTCFVCKEGDRVVGMIAISAERPFSLDSKLPDLDRYLPEGKIPCEVRLLSVEPGRRKGPIFAGLMREMIRHCRERGYDIGLISAYAGQDRLYRHLGFEPFGPPLGTDDAPFRAMRVGWDTLARTLHVWSGGEEREPPPAVGRTACFLPGPVPVSDAVREAFASPPVSHRAGVFAADHRRLRRRLADLVGAADVQILLGSGTLANDAVGAQLARLDAPGIVVANGEFGERLAGQAERWGFAFETVAAPWGEPLPYEAIGDRLAADPRIGWIWGVHCETSTGMLNDLDALKQLARTHGVRLCLDCISSVGTVPVDLDGVFLATCASGKGLGSYPGLSMVFHHHPIEPSGGIPSYLDLGAYAVSGVPYTFSSNLTAALDRALDRFDGTGAESVFARTAERGAWLRRGVAVLGLEPLAAAEHATPAVVTLPLPEGVSSLDVGEGLEREGIFISYRSAYLVRRNWVQVCLMGEQDADALDLLIGRLRSLPVLAPLLSGVA